MFGLPYAATLRTLNFNRTAFDAAGIKPPTYQWKPDDFLAAAQALTKGDGDKKQFGYVPCLNDQHEWMAALAGVAVRHLQGWDTAPAGPGADDRLEAQRRRALAAGASA